MGWLCWVNSRNIIFQLKGTIDDASTEAWIEEVEDRPFHDMRYPLDHSKMVALGWKPQVTWEDGLQQTSKLRNLQKYFIKFSSCKNESDY